MRLFFFWGPSVISITVILSVSGFLFLMRSLQEGPVAIVSALSGVGGIFVMVFVWIFGVARPGMIIEESGLGIAAQKLLAISLLGAGLICLKF